MTNIFIPKKIKIGFQKRDDTFTGKLAYVIYFNEKNVLCKEGSWNSWRDSKIEAVEYDNDPRTGYLFNKGIKRDGHFGSGRSVIRVYDPRDFEFEINVNNLMGILMHSNVSKRDIEEPCVFAWQGKDLVLLPTNSLEYEAAVKHTIKQDQKVSFKNLTPGATLLPKKSSEPHIYIGHYDWFHFHMHGVQKDRQHSGWGYKVINKSPDGRTLEKERIGEKIVFDGFANTVKQEKKGKKHVFFDGCTFSYKEAAFFSEVTDETPVKNYAELVDAFFKLPESGMLNSYSVEKMTPFEPNAFSFPYTNLFSVDSATNIFTVYKWSPNHRETGTELHKAFEYQFKDGQFIKLADYQPVQHHHYGYGYGIQQKTAHRTPIFSCAGKTITPQEIDELFEQHKIGFLAGHTADNHHMSLSINRTASY